MSRRTWERYHYSRELQVPSMMPGHDPTDPVPDSSARRSLPRRALYSFRRGG